MSASRREFLRVAASAPAALALAALEVGAAHAQAPLRPTRSCADSAPTPRQTEGPYFKPASPARASLLEPGLRGTRIVVTGTVLSTGCQPVPRALIDVWHADESGSYDNTGYRLRGHQFSGHHGPSRLEPLLATFDVG